MKGQGQEVKQQVCMCVTVLGCLSRCFEGGYIQVALPKQSPLQAEGPPLSKPPAAPPGGLPGVTALDGEPHCSVSIP